MGPEEKSFGWRPGHRSSKVVTKTHNLFRLKSVGRLPKWGWCVLAMALGGLVAAGVFQLLKTRDPNDLLAQAYTQRRTIELRIPGAKYSALAAERKHVGDARNASFLLEARIVLSRGAGQHEHDPSWIRSQSMAFLLMGEYKAALRKIDDALQIKPQDPLLLRDRATIVYEGSQETFSRFPIGESIDELSEVLETNPRDPIALFNRAVLYEKAYLPDLAVADWARFLEVETQGGWADEARGCLRRLLASIQSHEAGQSKPFLSEEAFVDRLKTNEADPAVLNKIEGYLDLAVRNWLPKAYGANRQNSGAQDAKRALRALAKVLEQRHSDGFVSSLLNSPKSSPFFERAIEHLAQAVEFSSKGNPVAALKMANDAGREFLEAGSRPGYLRAEVEAVYALRSGLRGNVCLLRASRIAGELEKTKYQWMKIQLRLDRCACFLMSGEFEKARKQARSALDQAKFRDFPVLKLRASGLSASVDSDEGDLINAWDEDEEGLRDYWVSQAAPPRRAQQFLDDLSYLAESRNESRLAYAFARESAEMISRSGDVILEATAREHVVQLAIRNHDVRSAREELVRAQKLLGNRSGKGMEAYQVWIESHLAEIDAGNGEIDSAYKHLANVRRKLSNIQDFDVRRAFFKAQAAVSEMEGDTEAAATALETVLKNLGKYLPGPRDAHARSVWVEENSDLYRSLARLLLQEGDAKKSLAVFEWYRANLSNASFNTRQSLALFLKKDLALRIKGRIHDRQVLSYAVFPKYLVVWVTSSDGTKVRITEIEQNALLERIARFSQLCADPESDLTQLRVLGRELFDLFIGDVLLRAGQVVLFEPDPLMGDVPFAALVGRNAHYLGEDYAIQFSPSLLHLLDAGSALRFNTSDRGLLVGSVASLPGSENKAMPATDAIGEVEQISSFFPRSSILKGGDATVPSVEGHLPEATFLHLAGHAVSEGGIQGAVLFDSSNPKTRKSVIWNPSTAGKRLLRRCRLAVFSACSTAQTDRGRTEQSVLLMRSFVLAGVTTVVGSSWDVDSRSTSRFMVQFYRLLISGMGVPESLRAAAETLRGRRETQHPYYWASFSVFASN